MNRTVRIQLNPTPEQAQALTETLEQFTLAFNEVCAYGWQHNEKNGVRLHHAVYYSTKKSCPGLVSDLLIQARVKATEALKSAFTWKLKHEGSYPKKVAKALKQGRPEPIFKPVKGPISQCCSVRYNEKTSTLNWQTQTIRLSTTQGKMSLSFSVPEYSARYAGNKVATADLILRKGKWWLHVVVDVPEPVVVKNDEVMGVDLGLNHPAVTSSHQFLGSAHWKEVDRRAFRLRRKLQSKGSKSAIRHLKKLSKRQARFHRDCDHVLAKRLVQQTPSGATIVLEISPTSVTPPRSGAANRTRTWRTNENCIVGPLPNCMASSITKGKSAGSRWSEWTPGTRAKCVVVVDIKPAIIAALNRSSFAARAATVAMQIIMLQKTFETSTSLLLPVSVYP